MSDQQVFGKWRIIHRDTGRVVGFHVTVDGRVYPRHPVVAIVEKGTETQMVPRPEARREWAHLRALGFRLISPQDREYMEDFWQLDARL